MRGKSLANAIVRQQQPSRASLAQLVRVIARGRLGHEREQRLGVSAEENGEASPASDRAAEVVSGEGQRVSRDLAECLGGHAVGAEEDREADEPFVADEGALTGRAPRHDADDGDRRALGEVHALHGGAILVNRLAELELLATEKRRELRVLGLGQRRQKPVARGEACTVEERLSLRGCSDSRH